MLTQDVCSRERPSLSSHFFCNGRSRPRKDVEQRQQRRDKEPRLAENSCEYEASTADRFLAACLPGNLGEFHVVNVPTIADELKEHRGEPSSKVKVLAMQLHLETDVFASTARFRDNRQDQQRYEAAAEHCRAYTARCGKSCVGAHRRHDVCDTPKKG